MTCLHRIVVRTREAAWEATRRLREHGFDAEIRWKQSGPGEFVIDFLGEKGIDLDFLRPDLLPPR